MAEYVTSFTKTKFATGAHKPCILSDCRVSTENFALGVGRRLEVVVHSVVHSHEKYPSGKHYNALIHRLPVDYS